MFGIELFYMSFWLSNAVHLISTYNVLIIVCVLFHIVTSVCHKELLRNCCSLKSIGRRRRWWSIVVVCGGGESVALLTYVRTKYTKQEIKFLIGEGNWLTGSYIGKYSFLLDVLENDFVACVSCRCSSKCNTYPGKYVRIAHIVVVVIRLLLLS